MLVELHRFCSAERRVIANCELERRILKHLRLFEITRTEEDHGTHRNRSQCTCRYASRMMMMMMMMMMIIIIIIIIISI